MATAAAAATSAGQRIAVLAYDDTVASCLKALSGSGLQVLGISAGDKPCPMFAKSCTELGFDCTVTRDTELAAMVIKHFKAEAVITLPDLGDSVLLDRIDGVRKFKVRFGNVRVDTLWPEFFPIWDGAQASEVMLLEEISGEDRLVDSKTISISETETAMSLRLKHMEQTKRLMASITRGSQFTQATSTTVCSPLRASASVPTMVSVEWDLDKVDRFLRAHFLPPHDPAKVEDPSTGEAYFVEDLVQFHEFKNLWSSGLPQELAKSGAYVADTHWYKITNDGLRKVGEQSAHKPRHVKDGAFPVLIPGSAVKGGRKKLRMNEPVIGLLAERYCSSVLASTWIGVEGPYIKRFEAMLARICGCAAACAVQSGTAACYGAMKALGVSAPSNVVLVPAFTCSACADAVIHAGGTPVPIDCDTQSYGVSAEAVEDALKRDTSNQVVGIVIAPCYGVPLRDYHKIYEICQERGLWLCEDACESYGATVTTPDGMEVPLGSLSTITVVSTRSEKMIGVGEGGAILSNDIPLVTKARWWCSRAPKKDGTLWRVYEHEAVGQNFRMSEMLAAIGCAAGEMFPATVERKRAIHAWYEKHMSKTPELSDFKLQIASEGVSPVWWINTAVLPEGYSAEALGMRLMNDFPDIEIRPGFYPLDKMEIFKSKMVVDCTVSEMLFKRLIALPSSVHLQEEDVQRVVECLAATFKELQA